MKKVMLLVIACMSLAVGTANAAMVDCAAPPPPALTVDTYPPPGASNVSYSCNGLTFTGFEAVDAGTKLPVVMNLVTANWDTVSGWVYLTFNPNMTAAVGTVEDMWFYFNVSGPLTGVDLAVGGNGASINERVCSDGVDRTAGNTCVGGLPNQLAVLTNTSGNAAVSSDFDLVNSASVFKDINLRAGVNSAGELTAFTQSFHTAPIPEPGTYALMGAGLLLLGVLRRKRNA